MSNLFDSFNYPIGIPTELVAGDRWAWKRTDASNYGEDYTLSYELTPISGGDPITLTATFASGEYLVEISAATTVNYAAGTYAYVALITRDSDDERVRIGYGSVVVKPDPATSTADTRSHARITLDAIEAVIQNRATQDQMAYTINGRELQRTPIPDLLKLRDVYKAEVRKEDMAEKVRKGMNTGSQIKVRMR